MSTLDTQSEFTRLVARLIDKAFELGYEVSLGDAYRDPRVHGALGVKMGYGHPKSAHKTRLAIDLNLFKGGTFLSATEDHRELGEWWEKQHELARWGGRFKDSTGKPAPDGNHYSLEWNGIK